MLTSPNRQVMFIMFARSCFWCLPVPTGRWCSPSLQEEQWLRPSMRGRRPLLLETPAHWKDWTVYKRRNECSSSSRLFAHILKMDHMGWRSLPAPMCSRAYTEPSLAERRWQEPTNGLERHLSPLLLFLIPHQYHLSSHRLYHRWIGSLLFLP